jgi:isopentenyl-diphosphate Delta-isomerase
MMSQDPSSETKRRKAEHIRINLEEDVRGKNIVTGFDSYRFVHQALPELNLGDVRTELDLFDHRLNAPLLISSMTGGVPQALEINKNLARAAQRLGLAMGLGSQRLALERSQFESFYRVRDEAPDILLFANLGAVQLNYGYGVEECMRAVEMVGADALFLHLNPLQEAVQPEGNTNFAGLAARIGDVCRALTIPVVVKEVGWGISHDVAIALAGAGVAGIDVAGAGGTSWSEVERHRATSSAQQRVAGTFASWGISTADSLRSVRQAVPQLPLFASGGVRNGIDVAKAIALGASIAGLASPLLRAAVESSSAVHDELTAIVAELRIAMFCIGAQSLVDLRGTSRLLLP